MEIRKMLHPNLCEGVKSEEKTTISSRNKILSTSKSYNNLYKAEKTNVIDQTPDRSVFSRYKEFTKMNKLNLDVVRFLMHLIFM